MVLCFELLNYIRTRIRHLMHRWWSIQFVLCRHEVLDHFWVFFEHWLEKYLIHDLIFEKRQSLAVSVGFWPFELPPLFGSFLVGHLIWRGWYYQSREWSCTTVRCSRDSLVPQRSCKTFVGPLPLYYLLKTSVCTSLLFIFSNEIDSIEHNRKYTFCTKPNDDSFKNKFDSNKWKLVEIFKK